jgi:hypothetical protein
MCYQISDAPLPAAPSLPASVKATSSSRLPPPVSSTPRSGNKA